MGVVSERKLSFTAPRRNRCDSYLFSRSLLQFVLAVRLAGGRRSGGSCQIISSTSLLTNRELPSHRAALTPPGWLLLAVWRQ